MQALRRQEEEPEAAQPPRKLDEEEPAQALHRALSAEDEMPPEPRALQALRREVNAPPAPGAAGPAPSEPAPPLAAFEPPLPVPAPDGRAIADAPRPERPRVQIDQIDVVIHEEAAPRPGRGGDGLSGDLGRLMRSAYLRGL